jgi:hypothetical protein
MNPLTSVRGSLITGFAIAIIFAVLSINGGVNFNELGLARWLHIIAGITWIGLLYYFNAVQVPALAAAAAGQGRAGRRGNLQVRGTACAALVPLVGRRYMADGRLVLSRAGNLIGALALGHAGPEFNAYQFVIGVGAWLGTIMLFNVWVFIWPNQKKILGLRPRPTSRRRPRARPRSTPRAPTTSFRSRC